MTDSKPHCRCEPCPHCGYKHYCNIAVDHPDGMVRCGGCPAETMPDPLEREETDD